MAGCHLMQNIPWKAILAKHTDHSDLVISDDIITNDVTFGLCNTPYIRFSGVTNDEVGVFTAISSWILINTSSTTANY